MPMNHLFFVVEKKWQNFFIERFFPYGIDVAFQQEEATVMTTDIYDSLICKVANVTFFQENAKKHTHTLNH